MRRNLYSTFLLCLSLISCKQEGFTDALNKQVFSTPEAELPSTSQEEETVDNTDNNPPCISNCSAVISKVTAVNGSFTHLAKIKIQGSSLKKFGLKKALLFDERDNASAYASIPNNQHLNANPGIFPWEISTSSTKGPLYFLKDGTDARGASKIVINCPTHGCWIGNPPQISNTDLHRSLYISWYMKYNLNPSTISGSHKFVRVWDEISNGVGTRISWTEMHMTYPALTSAGGTNWSAFPASKAVNEWHRMTMYVDDNKNSILTWVDELLVHNIKDFKKLDGYASDHYGCPSNCKYRKDDPFNFGLIPALIGFDTGGAYNVEQMTAFSMKMGEFIIYPDQARIEICSQSNFDQCTDAELQVVDSITDNEINFSLNLGAIQNLKGKYLHIINSDGDSIYSHQL